ncbi:SDR family NAD(P)-dependent oxidoreductase [Rhodovulum sp. YNF3179]|uniref:SDR family NAD(P)-dependent oxidoreductase n=1 Tax=Rhodovulum sp. YNF3179 TaxID=3425127 RepID=UPI003D331691
MTGAVALVTGASRGLGAAMAEKLAGDGVHVVALARTTGGLEELDDRIQAAGGTATLAPMDVTNEDAIRQLCRAVHDRWGRLDMIVHAAIHAAPLSPAGHIDARDWDRSIDVNLRATGRLIALAEPLVQAAEAGRAIFFDDPHAGEKFFGAYGATKSAQVALARSWQAEMARTGPAVHVLAPRPMPTATRARFFPGEGRAGLAAPADEAARLLAELG